MKQAFRAFLILSIWGAITVNAQTAISTARGNIAADAAMRDRSATNMALVGIRGRNNSAAQEKARKEFRKNVLATLQEQEVTVDRVVDGDTFETVVSGRRLRLRLAGIDAPEEGQENWQNSKDRFSEKVLGKKVLVTFSTFYPLHVNGFYIVRASLDKEDMGSFLLNNGWAWYDKTYGVFFEEKQDEENIKAMKNARSAKLGIWKNGKADEPWEYFEKEQKKKTTKN